MLATTHNKSKMKHDELYDATIPVFVHYLGNLRTILEEGKRHVAITNKSTNKKTGKQAKMTEEELISARLAPDMYTFIQQIGYAYFMTLEAATILAGKEMPKFTYDEKTIAELDASLLRAILYLKTIKPRDFAREEEKQKDKKVKTYLHPTKRFSREAYVHTLAVPNFFFHVTTAYDIFRHKGVPLGKSHFLDT